MSHTTSHFLFLSSFAIKKGLDSFIQSPTHTQLRRIAQLIPTGRRPAELAVAAHRCQAKEAAGI